MSSLPVEIRNQYGITCVPPYVAFGTDVFRDQVDLSHAEFYRRLTSSGAHPVTTQSTVADFEQVYREILEKTPGATILSIHMTSKLSGTYASAQGAARRIPNADIRVLDTGLLSLAEGLVVRRAALMASQGETPDRIMAAVSEMSRRVSFYYVFDTLDYAYRSGRIGWAARFMGRLLDAKPVLTLKDGQMVPHSRAFSKVKAVAAIMELAVEACRGGQGLEMAVMHANVESEAQALVEYLKQELQPDVILMNDVGPSVATNSGPGALGISWYFPVTGAALPSPPDPAPLNLFSR